MSGMSGTIVKALCGVCDATGHAPGCKCDGAGFICGCCENCGGEGMVTVIREPQPMTLDEKLRILNGVGE